MNLKVIILGVFLILIIWIGYVAYAAMTAEPHVEAKWGNVNEKTTEIIIDASLRHPLLVPASINELSINFTGVKVAWVKEFNYGATKSDMSLSLLIDNYNLVKALINYLNNGQNGEINVILKGKVLGIIPVNKEIKETISENVLGYLNFTAESREYLNGLFQTPALLGTKVDWAGERNGKALLIAHMRFYNPNNYPLPVANTSFDIYANGIKIGYGSTEKAVVIPAKGYATINVDTYIYENALPKVWALHVQNGEKSTVRAEIFLNLKLLGKEYNVKIASYEETIQTNIMEELNRMLNDMLKG
ncbi:LEA type 2 family protein [Thermococcus sp.]